MNVQPKLVNSPSTDKKTINLKGSSSRARFLLGLNNKVSRMDERIKRLEKTTDHILQFSIGYKELALTFILAVLVFTSITLAVKEFPSNDLDINAQILRNPQLLLALSNTLAEGKPSVSDSSNTKLTSAQAKLDQFKWPLERTLNLEEITYTQHKNGIELDAQLGDPVVSIDEGKVLYSGDAINSYGNLILIQHQSDIISVYGNNYSNYVEEGDTVSKGQLIAAVGEGNGKQPRLYFEIRHKGKAEDPFLFF